MKSVCVIGANGYVGKAVSALFQDHHTVVMSYQDVKMNPANPESDIGIICVPTPMGEDGKCDTSIVEAIVAESRHKSFLIKSAVPPGTTERLVAKYNKVIAVSPEYIGEGKYPLPFWHDIPHPTDMKRHNFQIFGGTREATKIMVELFTPVMGPYVKYIQTDAKTAELTKYMENCYFATKVVFCHEFFRIAEEFGVDYNELRELWLLDGRVERGCTAVFNKNGLGYGGKCLPKDISAIYHAALEAGCESKFLKQVMDSNADLRGGIYGGVD